MALTRLEAAEFNIKISTFIPRQLPVFAPQCVIAFVIHLRGQFLLCNRISLSVKINCTDTSCCYVIYHGLFTLVTSTRLQCLTTRYCTRYSSSLLIVGEYSTLSTFLK